MLTPIDVVDVPTSCPHCAGEVYATATAHDISSTYGTSPQIPCVQTNGRFRLSATWTVDLKCVGCTWSTSMTATDG